MSEAVLDFTRRVKTAVRSQRRVCAHAWREAGRAMRGGGPNNGYGGRIEVCSACGDQFPCRGYTCNHLDCIERGIALGRRRFPRTFPISVAQLADGHVGDVGSCPACSDTCGEDHHRLLIDTDLPAERWLLPVGWRLDAAPHHHTTEGAAP